METANLSLDKPDITFAKIVSTPTLHAWSQVYNAGNLFAVLSLASPVDQTPELPKIGKEVFSTLEQEFFTLETKSLASIKEAVETTLQKIPSEVSMSFVTVSIQPLTQNVEGKKDIMYVYGIGEGKVLIKRGDTLGTVLSSKELTSLSGILEDNDTIILQTQQFTNLISEDQLTEALKSSPQVSEIAETLTPQIHKHEDGAASAFVITYKKPKDQASDAYSEDKLEASAEEIPTPVPSEKKKLSLPSLLSFISPISSKIGLHNFNKSKKLILGIALLLTGILSVSVFFAVKNQQEAKNKAIFQEVYSQAEKKYEEGQNLLSLNKDLAHDDFEEAKKILENGRTKIIKDSKEDKELQVLLKKVTASLSLSSDTQIVTPQSVSSDTSVLLSYRIKNPKTSYITSDEKNLYAVTSSGVSIVDKKTQKGSVAIQKAWEDAGGIGVFGSNIYVLDKNGDQVFKFTPSSGNVFAKSNYFPSSAPDLSEASSMAIDGSIWILHKDGSIQKFTRAKKDTLTISGLEKSFSNSRSIFTNSDTKNVYVLDPANSRIVVLGKDGIYQSQYQADLIKKAEDFDVLEKEKKIFILSEKKIWQLDLP